MSDIKKIVIIGGGTGLSTLLRGVKYIKNIKLSAIVTISDDGGSTGVLSNHFSIPAVGDIRRVIGALSEERELLEKSLEFRFKNTNSSFDGHAVGNIIILSEILRTGSFTEAITNVSKMLNIKGQIIPVAEKKNQICASFENGSISKGESNFHKNKSKIKKVFFEDKNLLANPRAIKKILEADYIIFGIGSIYTSVIPNLIYKNVSIALKKTKAKIIYFGNITTETGETDGMTLQDHINALEKHTHKDIIDIVAVSSTKIPEHIVKKYNENGQDIINNNLDHNKFETIKGDLLNFENDIIRHDPLLIEKFFKKLIKK